MANSPPYTLLHKHNEKKIRLLFLLLKVSEHILYMNGKYSVVLVFYPCLALEKADIAYILDSMKIYIYIYIHNTNVIGADAGYFM